MCCRRHGLQAPLARVLASVTAAVAKAALQALLRAHPQACKALLALHLTPVSAELLTCHFEAAAAAPGRWPGYLLFILMHAVDVVMLFEPM